MKAFVKCKLHFFELHWAPILNRTLVGGASTKELVLLADADGNRQKAPLSKQIIRGRTGPV